MTALLTLERGQARRHVHRAADYRPAPVESQIGLRPGERMKVADLMRGLLLESGNDAAVTLAEGVSGSRARVRARDEPARARSSGSPTRTTRTRSGSTSRATTRRARDLVELAAASCARTRFFRRSSTRRQVTLHDRRPPAHVHEPQHAGRRVRVGQRRQDRPHARRRLRARRLGAPQRHPARSPPCSARRATPRATPTRCALLSWAFPHFQRITRGRARAARSACACRSATAAAPSSSSSPGRTRARGSSPRGQRDARDGPRVEHARARSPGPIRRGQSSARSRCCQDGKLIATVPLVAAAEVPDAGLAQRTKSWFTTPIGVAARRSPCWAVRCCWPARAARAGPRRDGHAQEARAA